MRVPSIFLLLSSPLYFATASFGDQKSTYVPKPKMNGKAINYGDRSIFSDDKKNGDFSHTVTSKVAFFTGGCSSNEPFQFSLGGRSGRGVIGTPYASVEPPTTYVTSLSFVDSHQEGEEITLLVDETQSNFFPFTDSVDEHAEYFGVPFNFSGMNSQDLSSISVYCSSTEPVDIVVIVTDDEPEVVSAKLTHALGSDNVHVEIEQTSIRNLHAQPMTKAVKQNNEKLSELHLRVIHGKGNGNDIFLQKKSRSLESYDSGTKNNGCTFVQMTKLNVEDYLVPKTVVVCSEHHDVRRDRKLLESDHGIKLDGAEIDENGDIVFKFMGLEDKDLGASDLKLDARIGVVSECVDETIEVVDMTAMLPSVEPTLVVNGGWFRRAVELHEVSCDWEPIVLEAIATDPNAKYNYLGHLKNPAKAIIMKGNNDGRNLSMDKLNKRRNLLKAPPSDDELKINKEMTIGRKPDRFVSSQNSPRDLQEEIHKKVLVHGYCSTGAWNEDWFTDAITFTDPDTAIPVPDNWNIHQFAIKILKFTEDNNIYGCGIIAHSQGGLASLHLKYFFNSCLDYANGGGDRLIQSAGSPYQGTNLQINGIGGFLGLQTCGYNFDLTEEGASNWLETIPMDVRGNVYYATSNPPGGFALPCLFSTHLILNDPEDGVVERQRAILEGGNLVGHFVNHCHAIDMNYPAQYENERGSRGADSKSFY